MKTSHCTTSRKHLLRRERRRRHRGLSSDINDPASLFRKAPCAVSAASPLLLEGLAADDRAAERGSRWSSFLIQIFQPRHFYGWTVTGVEHNNPLGYSSGGGGGSRCGRSGFTRGKKRGTEAPTSLCSGSGRRNAENFPRVFDDKYPKRGSLDGQMWRGS